MVPVTTQRGLPADSALPAHSPLLPANSELNLSVLVPVTNTDTTIPSHALNSSAAEPGGGGGGGGL